MQAARGNEGEGTRPGRKERSIYKLRKRNPVKEIKMKPRVKVDVGGGGWGGTGKSTEGPLRLDAAGEN